MSDMAKGSADGGETTGAATTDVAAVAGRWVAWVAQGGLTRDFLGIDTSQLEAAYHYATQLYQQRRYREAATLFSFLSAQNQWESRYLWGVAGCAQMLGRFDDAVAAYGTIASLDLSDPTPLYRLAECLVALEQREDAMETLRHAVALADGSEHAALRARAQAMRDWLTRETKG